MTARATRGAEEDLLARDGVTGGLAGAAPPGGGSVGSGSSPPATSSCAGSSASPTSASTRTAVICARKNTPQIAMKSPSRLPGKPGRERGMTSATTSANTMNARATTMSAVS